MFGAVVVGLLISFSVVIICASVFSKSPQENTCKDPNNYFKFLSYENGSETVWIKYNVSNSALKFAVAEKRCEDQNSELWEVLDGKPEWDAMSIMLRAIDPELVRCETILKPSELKSQFSTHFVYS